MRKAAWHALAHHAKTGLSGPYTGSAKQKSALWASPPNSGKICASIRKSGFHFDFLAGLENMAGNFLQGVPQGPP